MLLNKYYKAKYAAKLKVLNLVEAWYSLEQYIGLKEDKAFTPLLWTSSGLKGTWKLSTYIGLVSLRCAKTVKNW